MFALGNVIISTGAALSLGLLCFKIKKPFKQHSFNTFAYIILLLIVYALIGKYCLIIRDYIHEFKASVNNTENVVRAFYFFIDKDSIGPKMQGFLATYPSINLVICSYLLSNQW
jgi:hypothetical protein